MRLERKRERTCASIDQTKQSKAKANHFQLIEEDNNKPILFEPIIGSKEASLAARIQWKSNAKPETE